jgi:preprotein translocase subunit SecY
MLDGVTKAPRGPVSLLGRAAVTVAGVGLYVLMAHVPLPNVDDAALQHAHVSISPMSAGVLPFIAASGLVAAAALVIPQLRRVRDDARRRAWLARVSGVLALVFALLQAFAVAMALQGAGYLASGDWEKCAVVVATLVGGSGLSAAAAQWMSRRGLVNGFVVYALLHLTIDFLLQNPVVRAFRLGGVRDAALLVASIGVVFVATGIAVHRRGDRAAIPASADSAYRDARIALPAPWIPVPASSIFPVLVASLVVRLPAILAPFGVPGARAVATALEGDLAFYGVHSLVLLALTLLCASLLHRPSEIADRLARLGATTPEVTRAEAAAAFRRALPATFAYVLAFFAATHLSRGLPLTMVALSAATLLDLATSVRTFARSPDLVPAFDLLAGHTESTLRAALAAEGIETQVTGLATLSLLQEFGPYAPAQLLVHAQDANRASVLLRQWETGESRPKPTAAPRDAPVGDLAKPPTAALATLAALTAALGLVPGRMPPERAHAPRPEIELVQVDDQADPLRGVDEEALPGGGLRYDEQAPLGGGVNAKRAYLRVVSGEGESTAQTWARVRPWLEHVELPPGDRWAWEEMSEPIQDDDDDVHPRRWKVVGIRTLVVSGEPIVTTADITDAKAMLDDASTQASVRLTFMPAAGERFYAFTRTWLGRRLAIMIDGHVDSAPVIRQPIAGGRVQVTMGPGELDKQIAEARHLAAALRGEDDSPGPSR